MLNRRRLLVATAAGIGLLAGGAGPASPAWAAADTYSNQTIRLIVPYAAGGGTDAIARVIAQGVTEKIGQQVIVENNGTAGGNVATAQAAKAEPDGYTVLMANQGPRHRRTRA
jgi:tripartite-type tricarboxylate transporter receptor subunit TctC